MESKSREAENFVFCKSAGDVTGKIVGTKDARAKIILIIVGNEIVELGSD